jgi:MFS family permease
MTSRDIVALGIGQCVNWGVLYYAFGVLLNPLQRDLGVAGWVLASAFSLALLMSAMAAPIVGRWSDRGRGLQLVSGGGYVAASVLLLWTIVPGLPSLFLVWAMLGLCMAATLYEPAFIIIARAVSTPTMRLRALATVTVFGGLASTVFLPLTAMLVESWGWRVSVATLACILAVSTVACSRMLSRTTRGGAARRLTHPTATPSASRLRALSGVFGTASLASTAFTTTLVPALIARELTPMASAWVGGLLGVMQLPGRLLLMRGLLPSSATSLLIASLAAQALGIGVIAIGSTTVLLATGVTTFAIGGGLMTLARPHLVQSAFGVERAGDINGRLAGVQNLARAGGPVLAVGLASVVGYGAMFGVLAAVVATLAIVCSLVVDV